VSDIPSPPLVAEVQELILKTFDVSEQEAHDRASGLVLLAEGWGSPELAPGLDWAYKVKKRLGAELRWRSDAEREKFRMDQEQRHRDYEAYIQRGKRS
jgi:hypothetical protein